jgi:hypothetical protein
MIRGIAMFRSVNDVQGLFDLEYEIKDVAFAVLCNRDCIGLQNGQIPTSDS